jgi:hypothetical protein
MPLKLIILSFLLFQVIFCVNLFGQIPTSKFNHKNDSCKCNYSCWPIINDSINKLPEKQILSFLKTLGTICQNNIEFSEYSNEVLFKILKIAPSSTIKTIENHETELEISVILKEIENPIHDGLDLQNILRLIKVVKPESKIKSRIIESIKLAIKKTK